jgi:hypothetical protein
LEVDEEVPSFTRSETEIWSLMSLMTTKSDRFNEKEDYDPFQIVDRLGHKVRRITRMKTLGINSWDSRKTTGTVGHTLIRSSSACVLREPFSLL